MVVAGAIRLRTSHEPTSAGPRRVRRVRLRPGSTGHLTNTALQWTLKPAGVASDLADYSWFVVQCYLSGARPFIGFRLINEIPLPDPDKRAVVRAT
jgi:hypothetical protein